MTEQTQLKEYPEFSKKLVSNPVQNGWIGGIIAWFITMAIIYFVSIYVFPNASADILFLSIIVPIFSYKTEKKNLSKYKNPPKLDNIYKFYLHLGISMVSLSILYAIFAISMISYIA